MTLRRRMTLLAAGSVALALCLAAVIVYFAVRSELRGQVDDSLRDIGTTAMTRFGVPRRRVRYRCRCCCHRMPGAREPGAAVRAADRSERARDPADQVRDRDPGVASEQRNRQQWQRGTADR